MGWEEFDQQFDVEKLEAETGMWDFIGEHYGEATAERLHQYLTFSVIFFEKAVDKMPTSCYTANCRQDANKNHG